MNRGRVAGWAAVFGLLLTYVIVFERATPHKEEAQGARAARMFSFTGQQIREVRIASGPRAMRLVRKAGGWEADPSGGHNIPPESIDNLINTLLDTTRLDVVAEQPASLDQFGLASPAAQITILLENERDPVVLRLGAVAPSQVSMYAQVEHQPRVILIGTYLSFSVKTFLYNAGLDEER
jgi:hypothetical protein